MLPQDVGQLLSRVATQSDVQDDLVRNRLANAGLASSGVRYRQLRGAAQALLTGQHNRGTISPDEPAPVARWGSWIEGIPVAHAFLFNRGMIIDILPCRDDKAFRETYHCTPGQFSDLLTEVVGNGRPVYFNLRNYDPARPETADAYTHAAGLDQFYRWAEACELKGCYLNATRSKALLHLFDRNGRTSEVERRLGGTDMATPSDNALIRQLGKALDPGRHALIREKHPAALVRGPAGALQVPVPIQVFKRIGYHLAFSEICPDIPLHPAIAGLRDDIERSRPIDFDRLMTIAALATDLHHRYTAPLTGAYGGTYNMTGVEAAPQYLAPIGAEYGVRDEAYTQFIYAVLAGRIRGGGKALEVVRDVSGPVTLMQNGGVPDDQEFRTFLEALPQSEQSMKMRDELQKCLHRWIERRPGDDPNQTERYVEAATQAYERAHSELWKILQAVTVGTVAKIGANEAKDTIVISALTYTALKILEILTECCGEETAKSFGDRMYNKLIVEGEDSRQIVDIIKKLGQ